MGTVTSVKRSTLLAIPLRPMKSLLWTTSTPGHAVSTMNVLISRRLRRPSRAGVTAITTMISARGPLVHQSFSPFRIQCVPSGERSARVLKFAGSEPTSDSVSANADSAPPARRGR